MRSPKRKTQTLVKYRLRFDMGLQHERRDIDSVGQPVDFGGVGTRAGVGMGYGLTETLSLVAEVGYHGSFGAGEAANVVGLVGGWYATPTIYNGAFGWLANGMTPMRSTLVTDWLASVQTQGINVSADQVEYIAGQVNYIPVQGSLLASGLSGGVTCGNGCW